MSQVRKLLLLIVSILPFWGACSGGAGSSNNSGSGVLAAQTGANRVSGSLGVDVSASGTIIFEPSGPLALQPGQHGNIVMKNSGSGDISGLVVTLGQDLSSFIVKNGCLGLTALPAGGSCALSYNVPSPVTVAAAGDLTVTGINASQSPETLTINVTASSLGKFSWDSLSASTSLQAGQSGQQTLANIGGQDITNVTIKANSPNVTLGGSCMALGGTLKVGIPCELIYGVSANTPPGTQASVIVTAKGDNAEDTPFTFNIVNPSLGHFSFTPDTLELSENSTGTVVLKNTGGSAITGLTISNSSGLFSQISGCNIPSLASGSSCTLNFTSALVTSAQSPLKGTIIATGTSSSVDNNSEQLSVSVSAPLLGHFSFRYFDGTRVKNLNLDVPTKRQLFIKNTGKGTITNVQLTFSPAILPYFTAITCPKDLSPNDSCTLKYEVPAGIDGFKGDISVTGTNADNNN